jgi:hypothetical protein
LTLVNVSAPVQANPDGANVSGTTTGSATSTGSANVSTPVPISPNGLVSGLGIGTLLHSVGLPTLSASGTTTGSGGGALVNVSAPVQANPDGASASGTATGSGSGTLLNASAPVETLG